MAVKINEKALEKAREEAEKMITRYPARFLFIRKIIELYLENCEKIKAEEERERKEAEKAALDRMMADAGYFPGDCCD